MDLQDSLTELGLTDFLLNNNEIVNTIDITKLSGGEKQRVLLSKALLKTADVIILDEPDANIDNKTKNILIQNLINMKANKIIIIVSHDDDLTDVADEVIYLA